METVLIASNSVLDTLDSIDHSGGSIKRKGQCGSFPGGKIEIDVNDTHATGTELRLKFISGQDLHSFMHEIWIIPIQLFGLPFSLLASKALFPLTTGGAKFGLPGNDVRVFVFH